MDKQTTRLLHMVREEEYWKTMGSKAHQENLGYGLGHVATSNGDRQLVDLLTAGPTICNTRRTLEYEIFATARHRRLRRWFSRPKEEVFSENISFKTQWLEAVHTTRQACLPTQPRNDGSEPAHAD